MTDYKFPNTSVDAGCIVIADPSHYEEWGSKHGPTHSVSVENGDYIAKWTIPDGWLEENRKPTAQPLKITSGSLWVSDPCYVVGDDKWMEYLEKYKYFKEMPEGVIAINTGGDGGFTVCLKLTPRGHTLPLEAEQRKKKKSEENVKVAFVCDCGEKFDCWKCYEDHIFEVHGQVPVWTEQLKHQHILCEHHQGSPRAGNGSVIS